jgi:hypothetical protein
MPVAIISDFGSTAASVESNSIEVTSSQTQQGGASFELELTRDQMADLDQASSIELGFPCEHHRRERIKNLVSGGMRDKILVA